MTPLYDVIRAVAIVVAFGVGIEDKKAARIADMVCTGGLGLGAFLLPQFFLGLQTTEKVDTSESMLLLLCRNNGALLLATAVYCYYWRNTRDQSILGALLWSRALGLLPLMMVCVYGQLTYTKSLSERNVWFMGVAIFSLWMSNVIQLVQTRPAVGRRESGAVTIVCRLNFLVMFFAGMMAMAFPKMVISSVIENPSNTYLYFTRVNGGIHFASSIVAFYVSSFRDETDKKMFFCIQLMTIALVFASCLYSYLWLKVLTTSALMHCLIGFIPTVIPLTGVYLLRSESNSVTATRTYYTRSKRF